MDFKKDILLVDLETTGLDFQKHEIIQLAAVLLDRKTLKEKKALSVYVRPRAWKKRNLESMKINKIAWEQVKDAADIKEVLEDFEKEFNPEKVIFAHYGGPVDPDFLRAAYRKTGRPFKFDYHYFNLWGVFFAYLAARGKLANKKKFTGFSLDDFMEEFKLESANRHDALEDCRIEAEIFRKVMINL